MIYLTGEYEPVQTRLYLSFLPEDGVAVDVGANFGWYTCHFADHVGPKGRVFAFEPLPEFHSILRRNLELNGLLERAELVSKAVSDREDGSLEMFRFETLPAGHASAYSLGREDAVPLAVDVTTIDQSLSHLTRVDLMKLDIEGHELAALRGARATLSRLQPVVCFEVNVECLAAPLELEGELRALGYSKFLRASGDGAGSYVEKLSTENADYVAFPDG
jgi:FkbM family methyltransferase